MSAEPLVSVIIPVWNGERHLGAAIESALGQTHPAMEVVVVDDGSTDRSAELAERYEGVGVVRQAHVGVGAARNAGLAVATGSHVSFLDADDLFEPTKTALQLAAMTEDPQLAAVFGHAVEFWSPELSVDDRPKVRMTTSPVPARLPTSVLATRGLIDAVGLFNASPVGQGIDWFLRFEELGVASRVLDAVVYRRRIHDTNQGVRDRDLHSQRLDVLKAALDRRRSAPPS